MLSITTPAGEILATHTTLHPLSRYRSFFVAIVQEVEL